ncbi:radical SAM protein [uncultured Pseudodesulfovibrio sp.]|uniref:radical SAM protein n=1 Tax=uncultured Pseudodesulfovibrio sp. TaxID=2035858 RepID=UPI0029C6ACBF|nr:radical SAM protein [uncultured Pseudodesulfovibrio sp.]
MSKRSQVSPVVIAKLLMRHAKHPWIAKKLIALQAEKWFFNFMHPNREAGYAKKIRQLSVRITDVCNLRCIMCGQWGENGFLHGKKLSDLKKAEVSPDRFIELLDDLVAHGHEPNVYLWGGEPMLYDGTLDIIDHAAKLGLPPSIATNGTRMTEAVSNFIESPLYLLQVSIDGHNAELHNAIRRGPKDLDPFGAVMDGLSDVRDARERKGGDLPIVASLTTVSRDNYRHLIDIYENISPMVDFLVFYPSWWIDEESAVAHEQDYERRFKEKPTLHRGWIGGWRPDDYAIIDAQMQEIRKRSARWGTPPATFIPNIAGVDNLLEYYTNHNNTFGFNECISIYQAVEIDSNGDMSPCRDYHDYVVGNIKENTVTELWNSGRYRAFRASLHKDGLMPACSRCCGLMGY